MKKTLAFVLTAVMSLSLLAGCGSKTTAPDNTNNDQPQQAALSGSVSTNGSTSMEKVIGALSEQFMADNSGVSVTYDPTGSGAGIEAAGNGSADIGLASRALKDEEKAGGLTETVVALDGIAVIVNAGSKVEDLSVEQIAKIFTGEITDWSEVGGKKGAIIPYQRNKDSGSQTLFEIKYVSIMQNKKTIPAFSSVNRCVIILYSSFDQNRTTRNHNAPRAGCPLFH